MGVLYYIKKVYKSKIKLILGKMVKPEYECGLCTLFVHSNIKYTETGESICFIDTCPYGNRREKICESSGLISKAQDPHFDDNLILRAYIEGAKKEFLDANIRERRDVVAA